MTRVGVRVGSLGVEAEKLCLQAPSCSRGGPGQDPVTAASSPHSL